MATAYISLGTNLGKRQSNLNQAISLIRHKAGDVVALSSVYETEPWGFNTENKFYNQVIVVNTQLEPEALMIILLDIEKSMGRERSSERKYISRIIDLDILFYDDRIIDSEFLKIPHPNISDRRFILIPLNEIKSSLLHPVYQEKISELLKESRDQQAVKKIQYQK